MMRNMRIWLPLLVLLALAALFARGLQLDPRHLPSSRVGQAAPSFSLPTLQNGDTRFGPEAMRGQVWLLNVFASWCQACLVEHPRLLALAAQKQVALVGLAYKDNPDQTRRWLMEHGGNPYQHIAVDLNGRVGIDYGVYGVPETYVIDGSGTIRHRHVGPVDEGFFTNHVAPLLKTGS